MTHRCRPEQVLDSTFGSDELPIGSMADLRSPADHEDTPGVLDASAASLGDDHLDLAAGTVSPVNTVDGAFNEFEMDVLDPEDWQVALDALLEKGTPDHIQGTIL